MRGPAEERGPSSPAADGPRPEFVIRPGVRFPDWDCIRSADAQAALLTMFRAVRVERRWTDYSPALDRVRTAALRAFATRGHGPDAADLATAAEMSEGEVRVILDELAGRDLVLLGGDGRVTGAYPFTDSETGHSVICGRLTIRAMCAVDALGVGAMLGQDVAVLSSCRACGSPIRVSTAERGKALRAVEPAGAVVWIGDIYHANCAATSLCESIAFYCSDDHLERSRASATADHGHRLSVEEAHQVGSAIFGPMLRRAGARPG